MLELRTGTRREGCPEDRNLSWWLWHCQGCSSICNVGMWWPHGCTLLWPSSPTWWLPDETSPPHYTENLIALPEEGNSAVSLVWKLGVIILCQGSSPQVLDSTRLCWVSHIAGPSCWCAIAEDLWWRRQLPAKRGASISSQWLRSLWTSFLCLSFLVPLAYLRKDLFRMDCQ